MSAPARGWEARRAAALHRGPRGDQVTPMLVTGWTPAQRARIRAILLALLPAGDDAQMLRSPEMRVVALIDQASAGVSS